MEHGSPTPPVPEIPGRPRTGVTPVLDRTGRPAIELRRLELPVVEAPLTGDLRPPPGGTTTGVEVVEVEVEVVVGQTGIRATFPGTTSTTEDLTGTGTTGRTTEAMLAREVEAMEVKGTKTMEDLSRPNRATPTTGGWRRWRWWRLRTTSSNREISAATSRRTW